MVTSTLKVVHNQAVVHITVELQINHGDVTNRPIMDNLLSGSYHTLHDPT
jgi:hypothetical protein